jgi:hypothetical protein
MSIDIVLEGNVLCRGVAVGGRVADDLDDTSGASTVGAAGGAQAVSTAMSAKPAAFAAAVIN